MATEIELKAWVDDPYELKKVIDSLARFSFSFKKEDVYWYNPNSCRVRVRREEDTDAYGRVYTSILVTYKNKERINGIEVNEEHQFNISYEESFGEFLKNLDFKEKYRKQKQGFSWSYEGMTVELAEISKLGWFIELEIMTNDSRSETVTRSRTRLLDFLRKIGIGEDKIETRYYLEMLPPP